MMTFRRSTGWGRVRRLASAVALLGLAVTASGPVLAQSGNGPPQSGPGQKAPDKGPNATPADPKTKDPTDPKGATRKGPPAVSKLPETAAEKTRLLHELYAHLATAEDAATSARIAASIEALWAHSGSDTVNLLMQRAAIAMTKNEHDLALKLLDYVTELAPDFAEGFNRRAFLYFSMNDVEKAVGDLRRALALEPYHFKALEGLAQIWRETGNKRGAYQVLKQLLDIYPHAPGARQSLDELAKDVEGQGI